MAIRIEKNGEGKDIVISGFEQGIADSPELGIADMRSVNITSIPGEASVGFNMAAATIPPIGLSSVAYTGSATANLLTVASTVGYYNGMAIKIESQLGPSLSYLIVAGGGAGGFGDGGGGGGGGGGVRTGTATAAIGANTITVGAGGTGVTSTSKGGNGTDSSALSVTSTGGGGGGGGNASNGNNGGSGGGAGGSNGGGAGTFGTGTVGQGNNGGAGGSFLGGGGGGAGAAGSAGNGGNGVASSITGASVTYGGGGGAGGFGSSGIGGSGGGGAGKTGNANGSATNGTANTGGGGGGINLTSGSGTTGNGGSGVVIISYPTGSISATGGTITTSGGNTIHTFNSTGTFTVTGGITTSSNYYIGNLTSTTFKLYTDPLLATLVSLSSNTTGTFSVPSFGTPVWSAYYPIYTILGVFTPLTFILDTSGNAWYFTLSAAGSVAANSLQYMGNIGHSVSASQADFGLAAWKGFVFVIIGSSIDYISLSDFFAGLNTRDTYWVPGWKTNLTATTHQHYALPAFDDALYICNGSTLASIIQSTGSVFDPSTCTYNLSALSLPAYDVAQHVAQLGTQLLVGGILSYIYPWDRVSTSFSYPLICADSNIIRIVSTNSNAYVFAGTRGRIYITNGQQIQIFKKIPDSLTGNPEPYYSWQDALYTRNKLYFTFTATNNAGNSLSTMGGIWALQIDPGQLPTSLSVAGSLYGSNQLSYGTYGGSCPVLFYNQLQTPAGYGIGACWVNNGIMGIDIGASTPYTNFQTYIDTDIIPIGTFFTSRTFQQIEYKLSKPLVTGESVKISARPDLSSTFTLVWTSTSLKISDAKSPNFQMGQWVQFRAELSSTASSPSYARLKEIRLR